MQGEIWRRSRFLVAELLGELDEGPVGLPDLVATGSALENEEGRRPWTESTVRNTVSDLAAFGAVRVSGTRDRVVALTVLGEAWLAGVALPGLSAPNKGLRRAMAELLDLDDPGLEDGHGEPHDGE